MYIDNTYHGDNQVVAQPQDVCCISIATKYQLVNYFRRETFSTNTIYEIPAICRVNLPDISHMHVSVDSDIRS